MLYCIGYKSHLQDTLGSLPVHGEGGSFAESRMMYV